jgi:hypothetical protein
MNLCYFCANRRRARRFCRLRACARRSRPPALELWRRPGGDAGGSASRSSAPSASGVSFSSALIRNRGQIYLGYPTSSSTFESFARTSKARAVRVASPDGSAR